MEFHKDIQREIDRVPAHIEKVKSMQAFVIIADELEAAFDTYHHRYVDVNSYSVTVSFMFKTMDEAKAVLNYIMRMHGLRQTRKVWIYQGDKSLNWVFPGLMVTGHFYNQESGCRFVKVGEKTEPIFEMVCDDGSTPDALEPIESEQGVPA